ncbi:MAG: LysR family transcriptional regulator [Ruminococcaceae bacterium]|nr:LysR family transcriptional regulator [Oscillospiraceae bacterium]
MEFLQLYYFYESAKTESFALTAKKYMVPTSSVSASVKRLEKEIGTNLFDRTANRIKLNEKGYTFFQTIGEVFEKIDSTVSSISETKEQNAPIRILIKARRKWITELIIEYKKLFPRVNFQISHDALFSHIEEFDVIIDEKTEKYADRESFLLSVEIICVKTSKNNPLIKKSLTFKDLKNQYFIVSQRGSRMWQLLDKAASRSGFVPKIAIESNDRQCIIRYVESEMGLFLGSRRALSDDSEKNLAALNITDFNETQSVYVYYTLSAKSNISLNGFLAFLKTKIIEPDIETV